jgi:hypothetical protein
MEVLISFYARQSDAFYFGHDSEARVRDIYISRFTLEVREPCSNMQCASYSSSCMGTPFLSLRRRGFMSNSNWTRTVAQHDWWELF